MKRILLTSVFLFILTLVLRLPTIQRPFDLAYEHQLAFFGREAFAGRGFYSTPWSLKPPGESLVYGLAYIIFGHKYWVISVRIVTAILAGLGSIYVFKLSNKLFGFWPGLFSSLFFTVFLSRHDVFSGPLAYAEMLSPFFTIFGVLLFFLSKEKEDKRIFFLSGLSFGISLLFKQSAVYDFLPFFVYSVSEELFSGKNIFSVLLEHLSFMLGFILPLSVFVFYIIILGRFSLFWDWSVIKPALYSKLREKYPGPYILVIFRKVYLVWILAYLAILGTFFRKKIKTVFFIVWYFFTFFTFLTSGKFWNYYFIQPFIPACFLAGSFINDVVSIKKKLLSLIFLLGLFIYLILANYQSYFKLFNNYSLVLKNKVSMEDYSFSLSEGESLVNRYKAASAIKKLLKKEDKVFIMEGAPAMYVLTDTRPTYKDFLFELQFFENKSIGFVFNHSFQNIDGNRKALIEDLQADPPDYIIIVMESAEEAYDKLQSFPYFFAFTFLNYNYEANFGDVWIYAKKENILIPQKVLIEQNFYKKYFSQ